MTVKQKAEKLVLKYLRLQEEGSSNWFHKIFAKQCALIAVEEILSLDIYQSDQWFYQEVKKEIEKL
jgi:hypothetical protein